MSQPLKMSFFIKMCNSPLRRFIFCYFPKIKILSNIKIVSMFVWMIRQIFLKRLIQIILFTFALSRGYLRTLCICTAFFAYSLYDTLYYQKFASETTCFTLPIIFIYFKKSLVTHHLNLNKENVSKNCMGIFL